MSAKLTKRQKRKLRREGLYTNDQVNTGLNLKEIKPITKRQQSIFDSFDEKHLFVHGYAGTGKTYVLLYLALNSILDPNSPYENIKIFRSAVPTRDIGFLPGTVTSKMESFESPYIDIMSDLFDRDDAYAILKHKKLVTFNSTSYIRGSTYNNSIVIVDECQNLNWHEFSSLITRCGYDSKYLFCGDSAQSDLIKKFERMDIHRMVRICEAMPSFELVHMEIDDIVRSGLVKEFLIHAKDLEYGT